MGWGVDWGVPHAIRCKLWVCAIFYLRVQRSPWEHLHDRQPEGERKQKWGELPMKQDWQSRTWLLIFIPLTLSDTLKLNLSELGYEVLGRQPFPHNNYPHGRRNIIFWWTASNLCHIIDVKKKKSCKTTNL